MTGAGHHLFESIEVMEELVSKGFEITVFISQAGLEVVRIYGLEGKLRTIADGNYYRELVTPSDGASCSKAGRLLMRTYSALIASPASANTVAKIVRGIADTPPTIAVAQALKGGVKVLIVPTDSEVEYETETPHIVNRLICELHKCKECKPLTSCPTKAFELVEGSGHINLSKCIGCSNCLHSCPFGAVRFRAKIKAKSTPIDLGNVRKLLTIEGVVVLKRPREILREIEKIVGSRGIEGASK